MGWIDDLCQETGLDTAGPIDDLCQETGLDAAGSIKDYRNSFDLDPHKWELFSISKTPCDTDWAFVKYLNSKKNESYDFKSVTEKQGGVFIWMIQPARIPIPYFRYIAYIGMSSGNMRNSLNNFKKNVPKYRGVLAGMLFEEYASDLYVAYYLCDDNSYNEKLVKALVDAVQPPIKEKPIEISEIGREAWFL